MNRLESAQKIVKEDPAKAESIYKDILSKTADLNDAAMKEYEGALMGLGELYRDQRYCRPLYTTAVSVCWIVAVADVLLGK